MDMRQWDARQFNSGAHCKRSRDVESAVAEAITAVNGHNNYLEEREPLEEPDWKRRRRSLQPNASTWDTSVQTSLWLAQQNSLAPVASMNREGSSQTSRDDLLLNQVSHWPRRTETETGNGHGERCLEARDSAAANSNKISPRAHEATVDMQETTTTAAQFRKASSNIAGNEQHCEKCSQSETILRDSAVSLSQLVESLTLGAMADIISQASRDGILHEQNPHVSELHRIIDLLKEADALAKQVVRGAPQYLQNVKRKRERESPLQASHAQSQTSLETMKRRFLADSQDVLKRPRRRSSDLNSINLEAHDYQAMLPDSSSILSGSPRRLSTSGVGVVGNDVLPPIMPQSPSHLLSDGYGTRLPSMKPPPTPGRQLPSPPGRSHPSPPSYNMPSPSPILYPQSVTSTGAQPPQSSLPNILHPPSPTSSSSLGPSSAIQAHTAALQHEVSVKKYALQTLQGEHDKLLAALRRSQTRARALEEKQVASDLEINTLAEERVRLLTQVQELEQNIVDIAKSREDFRQAAVTGGAQYMKIVRMASQLEIVAGEERREWKRKLEENKATIDALRERQHACQSAHAALGEAQMTPNEAGSPVDDLHKEVQRLRIHCAEMETALKSIRIEGHRIGEAITTLGTAGLRISESATSVLVDSPPTIETRRLIPNTPPSSAPVPPAYSVEEV